MPLVNMNQPIPPPHLLPDAPPPEDFLTDDDIQATPKELGDPAIHPEYIGVVSGANYKMIDGQVSEYGLAVVVGGNTTIYAVADVDLTYLGRQIRGLVGK